MLWKKLPISICAELIQDWLKFEDVVFLDYVISVHERSLWVKFVQDYVDVKLKWGCLHKSASKWVVKRFKITPRRTYVCELDGDLDNAVEHLTWHIHALGQSQALSLSKSNSVECLKVFCNSSGVSDWDAIGIILDNSKLQLFEYHSDRLSFAFTSQKRILSLKKGSAYQAFRLLRLLSSLVGFEFMGNANFEEGELLIVGLKSHSDSLLYFEAPNFNWQRSWIAMFSHMVSLTVKSFYSANPVATDAFPDALQPPIPDNFTGFSDVVTEQWSVSGEVLVVNAVLGPDLCAVLSTSSNIIRKVRTLYHLESDVVDVLLKRHSVVSVFAGHARSAQSTMFTLQRLWQGTTSIRELDLSNVKRQSFAQCCQWISACSWCSLLEVFTWSGDSNKPEVTAAVAAQIAQWSGLRVFSYSLMVATIEEAKLLLPALLKLPKLRDVHVSRLTSETLPRRWYVTEETLPLLLQIPLHWWKHLFVLNDNDTENDFHEKFLQLLLLQTTPFALELGRCYELATHLVTQRLQVQHLIVFRRHLEHSLVLKYTFENWRCCQRIEFLGFTLDIREQQLTLDLSEKYGGTVESSKTLCGMVMFVMRNTVVRNLRLSVASSLYGELPDFLSDLLPELTSLEVGWCCADLSFLRLIETASMPLLRNLTLIFPANVSISASPELLFSIRCIIGRGQVLREVSLNGVSLVDLDCCRRPKLKISLITGIVTMATSEQVNFQH